MSLKGAVAFPKLSLLFSPAFPALFLSAFGLIIGASYT